MPHKSPKRTIWTLYESQKHGMTPELMTAFRQRAAAEGVDTIVALVRLMREYIASARPNGSHKPPSEQSPPITP